MKYRCTTFDASSNHLTLDIDGNGAALIFAENIGEGDALAVEVKKWKNGRSLGQNSIFHKLLNDIAVKTGNDLDTVKEYVKEQFGLKISYHGVLVNKPTHLYTVSEWQSIMEPAIALAIEYGIDTSWL